MEVAVATRVQQPFTRMPAPFGARLAALVLDWLVAFIIVSLFIVAAGLYLLLSSDMANRDPSDQTILNALLIASLAAPAWCVVTLLGYTWHGQSAGKLAMDLRVVAPDGEPPGLWRALVRLTVYVLEVIPLAGSVPVAVVVLAWRPSAVWPQVLTGLGAALLVPLISTVLLLWDRERRALHDVVAGTRVLTEAETGGAQG